MKKFDLIDVCRLIKGKRVDLLIEAMHILKHKFPKINAIVVGDGPERERLEQHAKAAGVNITFTGRVKDVYPYMKAAKIFVHCSIQEGGSSIVSEEANACGLPVVVVKHPLGISRELIEDGKNGYIVQASPKAIADCILSILADKKLYIHMQRYSKKFASNFDWSIVFGEYEKVVKEVVV